MANGVSISGKYAYVVLDSYTLVDKKEKPPLRGIAVIDMETESVIALHDGMDPGAESVVAYGDKVIVSFYGLPVWKYSATALHANVLPQPLRRLWKFPMEGRAVGAAAVDDTYYYTCFSRLPLPGEGSNFVKIPVALDRKSLMLD
ncbi:MAG: hypothetical protein EOP06_30225 [Proteobacteria bacterium]|nr:MAG: hypothetical protein EOP06_30225 [Pseudomonadota bacterium]